MLNAMLSLLLLLQSAATTPGPCAPHLFVIARSKNANIVAYDGKVDASGALAAEPVSAYWLLDGDASRREELTTIEFNRAYGFVVEPGKEAGTYSLQFKAKKGRKITIRMRDGCAAALTKIDGKPGVLRKLFVQSKEGGVMPKVEYVEFFGEDATTGAALYEKIKP